MPERTKGHRMVFGPNFDRLLEKTVKQGLENYKKRSIFCWRCKS